MACLLILDLERVAIAVDGEDSELAGAERSGRNVLAVAAGGECEEEGRGEELRGGEREGEY